MTIKLNDLSDADKKRKANNVVSHPSHYASGGIECKDAMKAAMGKDHCAWFYGNNDLLPKYLPPMAFYWWGCAFKYLWRWDKKNGVEDLQKCKQCIDFLIEEMGKE